ncbi:MAG: diguanylate cyclase [Clostridiales bacterium]|nr:diguanylate cyclase [Clostridiales bacterium]
MNETIKTLIERRSCKKYLSTPVKQELIDEVIKAGMYAPTGKNRQPVKIIAITDTHVRDELRKMNAQIMGVNENVDPFYGAPVVLLVVADSTVNTYLYDGSLVMGNLMLAAHSLGLGSCWIHRAKEEMQTEYGKNLLKSLGIEGEWEGIGHCVLGYADGELPAAKPRKEGWVHYV